jgi:hypothetical protein
MPETVQAVTGSAPATAAQPFKFQTSLVLQESTGLRASTLGTLARLLRSVPDSSIYYHTHYFVLQHHYLTPEPTNDFAYWVAQVLGEEPLGELLASIDILEHASLQSLRDALAGTIERYLQQYRVARLKFVSEGEEFFFLKSVHVVAPTPYTASTLSEFAHALEHISIHSLYFHIFDARLRVGRSTNDFALWLSEQLGLKALGEDVSRLDPYAYSLDTLRAILLSLVRKEMDRHSPCPPSPSTNPSSAAA